MADINDLKNRTVSHGTLNPDHLIPAFCDVLKEYAPDKYAAFIKGYPELDGWEDFLEADWRLVSDDTKMNASDDLFGLLNDIAPEGTMFSSTEGDGSDFGFWTVEEKKDKYVIPPRSFFLDDEYYDNVKPSTRIPLNPSDWDKVDDYFKRFFKKRGEGFLDDDEGEKALKKLQGRLSQYKGKTTGQIAADVRYDVATALDVAVDKAEDLMTKFGLDNIYVLRAKGLSPKAIAKRILKAEESKAEAALRPWRTDFEKDLQKRIDDAKGTKYDTKDFTADGWEFVTGDVYDDGSEYGSDGKDVAVAFFKREQDGQYYRMWLAFDPDTKEITDGKWWIESDESKNEDLNTAKDFVYSIAPIGILVRQAGQPGFKDVKNSDDHIIVGFMRHDNTRFIIDWDADKKQGTATRQVMVDDKDAQYGYKWVTPKSNANVTFTTREELKDFVKGTWDNTSSESKNESLTLKQKELKDMARYGEAEDITTISDAEAKELKKKGIETVGVSRGTYGNLVAQSYYGDKDGKWYYTSTRNFDSDYLPESKQHENRTKEEEVTNIFKGMKEWADRWSNSDKDRKTIADNLDLEAVQENMSDIVEILDNNFEWDGYGFKFVVYGDYEDDDTRDEADANHWNTCYGVCEEIADLIGIPDEGHVIGEMNTYFWEDIEAVWRDDESKKSESLSLKQKELKDMARYGEAEDITTISDAEAKELRKKGIELVGVSRGTYGMNGALLRDKDGNKYVITARSSNLFYFV